MTARNAKYLAFVRSRPCCVTGSMQDTCAAHVRMFGGGGMGLKPSDYFTVPLGHMVHCQQHSQGERSFWADHGTDPLRVMKFALLAYIEQRLEETPGLIEALGAVIESQKKVTVKRSTKSKRSLGDS